MKLKLLSLGLASLFVANGAIAEDFDVQVTVDNTLAVDLVTTLELGTIAATDGAAGDTATLSMAADGTITSTPGSNSFIASITDGTPGEYEITGAAPDTDITLTFSLTSLTDGTDSFNISQFNGRVDSSASPTPFTVSSSAGLVKTYATDSSGTLSFTLGATIQTAGTADAAYTNGVYSGTFTIDAAY